MSMGNSDDEPATRRELDQLRAEVTRMDSHGTRSTAVLGAQLGEVIRDVADLKADTVARFREHTRLHEVTAHERATNRRWAMAFAVAVLAAVGGLYPYLSLIAHH